MCRRMRLNFLKMDCLYYLHQDQRLSRQLLLAAEVDQLAMSTAATG